MSNAVHPGNPMNKLPKHRLNWLPKLVTVSFEKSYTSYGYLFFSLSMVFIKTEDIKHLTIK